MPFDKAKLNILMEQVIKNIGAPFHAPLVLIGEKLGLFKTLARHRLIMASELAAHTKTTERYVQEWLNAMASGGYVTYEPSENLYFLTSEQAITRADKNSPAYILGAFQTATAAIKSETCLAEAFRTGEGISWHECDPDLFIGAERYYRLQYILHLMQSWIPTLDGIEEKLCQRN